MKTYKIFPASTPRPQGIDLCTDVDFQANGVTLHALRRPDEKFVRAEKDIESINPTVSTRTTYRGEIISRKTSSKFLLEAPITMSFEAYPLYNKFPPEARFEAGAPAEVLNLPQLLELLAETFGECYFYQAPRATERYFSFVPVWNLERKLVDTLEYRKTGKGKTGYSVDVERIKRYIDGIQAARLQKLEADAKHAEYLYNKPRLEMEAAQKAVSDFKKTLKGIDIEKVIENPVQYHII